MKIDSRILGATKTFLHVVYAVASGLIIWGAVIVVHNSSATVHSSRAGAQWFSSVWLLRGYDRYLNGPGPNSPIKIVGGSIEFSTSGSNGWLPQNGPPPTALLANDAVDTTNLGIELDDGSVPQSWQNLTSWTVTLTDNGTNTVVICPYDSSAQPPCGSARASTQVYASITANSAPPPSFACDVYSVVNNACPNSKYFRYFDPPASANVPSYLDYITKIAVSVNGLQSFTYTCKYGHCNVYIGPQ
jgi:hypothetical protein